MLEDDASGLAIALFVALLRADRMVTDEWHAIIAVTETKKVTDSDKSDREECDDDRKQFSET